MITKIKTDRHYLFDPAAHIFMTVDIVGEPSIAEMKRAITLAVSEYDILNSRILMDSEGECYYVPLENGIIPDIEVICGKPDIQQLINDECKKEFEIHNGKFVRFIIIKELRSVQLVIVQHHLGGDGKSMLLLIENIMKNLQGKNERVVTKASFEREVRVFDKQYTSKFVEMNELVSAAVEGMNKKWKEESVHFDYNERTKVFKEFWKDRSVCLESFELNKNQLKCILKQCRKHGITLNNLFLALITKSQIKKEKIGIIVDVREKENQDMGNYVSAVKLEQIYDCKKNIWENAEYIDALIKSQIFDRSKLLLGALVRNYIDNGLQDAMHFVKVKSKIVDDFNDTFLFGKDGLPICISNLGVAPMKYEYGDYSIEKISFISPLAMKMHSNIAVITANNHLVFNMLILDDDQMHKKMFRSIKEEVFGLLEKDGIEEFVLV